MPGGPWGTVRTVLPPVVVVVVVVLVGVLLRVELVVFALGTGAIPGIGGIVALLVVLLILLVVVLVVVSILGARARFGGSRGIGGSCAISATLR